MRFHSPRGKESSGDEAELGQLLAQPSLTTPIGVTYYDEWMHEEDYLINKRQ